MTEAKNDLMRFCDLLLTFRNAGKVNVPNISLLCMFSSKNQPSCFIEMMVFLMHVDGKKYQLEQNPLLTLMIVVASRPLIQRNGKKSGTNSSLNNPYYKRAGDFS